MFMQTTRILRILFCFTNIFMAARGEDVGPGLFALLKHNVTSNI